MAKKPGSALSVLENPPAPPPEPALIPPSAAPYLPPGLARYVDLIASNQPFKQMQNGPGRVRGPGGPGDDMVPANLSNGEYALPTGVVDALGGGNNDAGASVLDAAVKQITGEKPVGSQEE